MKGYEEVTSVNQWKDILEESKKQQVLLLKHSTTCPVSAHAYREFTSFDSPIKTYLVKVIESRAVSNEIGNDLAIRHESPQVFLITNGNAIWSASHWKITKKEMEKAVESI
ncbi:bacillithiol system redox-active protein YtxJ [Psychrobacillus glaciei]|uniref:Bacillithiol system redox-active protein YtxJ n=1 Tax=Psychrobacillus glaciei TaxID=2283160 RepID=A0A5J6SKY7_9BACI|nr:bacillithiol system redox-active protein YtxJ [Psychrobacillus glaciei]QFF98103.1 bacillithiol system redox-active protein YtxJ [Psychrobacillus glaciei]